MKRIFKDLAHYLSLLGIFLAGIVSFVFFSYDEGFQIAVVIATAIAYVFWGLIHHFLHRDLYFSVIVEYVAVALLGMVIALTLVLRF